MRIAEQMIDTPTIAALKAKRAERQPKNEYEFKLTGSQLDKATGAGMTDAAMFAYGFIVSASRAVTQPRSWVTLRPQVRDIARRDRRWWYRATTQLELAGLIQCERHVGRLPRYRVVTTTTRGRP